MALLRALDLVDGRARQRVLGRARDTGRGRPAKHSGAGRRPASRSAGQCLPSGLVRMRYARPGKPRGEVQHVFRRLVGQGERRDAMRLGDPDREVAHQTGARASSGWPTGGHPRCQLLVEPRLCPASRRRTTAAGPPRTETRRPREPTTPSQATSLVQPIAAAEPGDQRVEARAAPIRTIRTWTGPAAWRNVPHCVATGKTRLVTRNVIRPSSTSGRSANRGPATAGPRGRSPRRGCPSRSRTLKRLWRTRRPHLEQPAGPTARWRDRVGGSFQAKMSKPVTENAFETAWPGSGLPKTAQVAERPRGEDDQRHDGARRDEPATHDRSPRSCAATRGRPR